MKKEISEILKGLKTETITRMPYSTFEALVAAHFNIPAYSFVASQECGNDTDHRFVVKASDDETPREGEYGYEDWQAFLAPAVPRPAGVYDYQRYDERCWSPYKIFGKLCADGVLPEGTYLVEVSW